MDTDRRVIADRRGWNRFLVDRRYALRLAAGLERLANRGCRDTLTDQHLDDIADGIRESAWSWNTIYTRESNDAVGRARAILESAGKRDGRVVCRGVQRSLPGRAGLWPPSNLKLKGKPWKKKRKRATTKRRRTR